MDCGYGGCVPDATVFFGVDYSTSTKVSKRDGSVLGDRAIKHLMNVYVWSGAYPRIEEENSINHRVSPVLNGIITIAKLAQTV